MQKDIETNNTKQRKKHPTKKVLISLLMIILIASAGIYAYLNSLLGKAEQVEIDEEDLGIIEEVEQDVSNLANKSIINIALFGIDSREDSYTNARSDSMIIATLDLEHKTIKLTSLMRDTYVAIDGRGFDKLGHAYAYGGPTLAIKTINTNFDMSITEFATVNFLAMEKIVDSVGGVEITLTDAETRYVPGINAGGTYLLTGKQAVAYSRIRYIGTDFARTERQRIVLEKVINKVLKDRSITKLVGFADSLLPYVQTSLSRSEILGLATKLITSGASEVKDARLPIDGHGKNAMINGTYYLKPNTLLDNVTFLHNFIYENDEYVPSARLLEISGAILN